MIMHSFNSFKKILQIPVDKEQNKMYAPMRNLLQGDQKVTTHICNNILYEYLQLRDSYNYFGTRINPHLKHFIIITQATPIGHKRHFIINGSILYTRSAYELATLLGNNAEFTTSL